MELIFEWDKSKAISNYRKHGVRFEDATHVFDDPLASTEPDRSEHGEYRWRTIGMADGSILLIVAHTVRYEGSEVIRIISARRANKEERRRYEHG
jgi:uncharacterized DUF497 family protein